MLPFQSKQSSKGDKDDRKDDRREDARKWYALLPTRVIMAMFLAIAILTTLLLLLDFASSVPKNSVGKSPTPQSGVGSN